MVNASLLPPCFHFFCSMVRNMFCFTPVRCSRKYRNHKRSVTTCENRRDPYGGNGSLLQTTQRPPKDIHTQVSPFLWCIQGVVFPQRPSSTDRNGWLTKSIWSVLRAQFERAAGSRDDQLKYNLPFIWCMAISCSHPQRIDILYLFCSVGPCGPFKKEYEVQHLHFRLLEVFGPLGLHINVSFSTSNKHNFFVADKVLLGSSQYIPVRLNTRPECQGECCVSTNRSYLVCWFEPDHLM